MKAQLISQLSLCWSRLYIRMESLDGFLVFYDSSMTLYAMSWPVRTNMGFTAWMCWFCFQSQMLEGSLVSGKFKRHAVGPFTRQYEATEYCQLAAIHSPCAVQCVLVERNIDSYFSWRSLSSWRTSCSSAPPLRTFVVDSINTSTACSCMILTY